jgi:hypothetical protein
MSHIQPDVGNTQPRVPEDLRIRIERDLRNGRSYPGSFLVSIALAPSGSMEYEFSGFASRSSAIDALALWYTWFSIPQCRLFAESTLGWAREVGRYFLRVMPNGELADDELLIIEKFERNGEESWTAYPPDLLERIGRRYD